jgi:transcriptional regulator with XRE-family HTH domain
MHTNLKLKIEILTSGQRQRQIAAKTGIAESRLSSIIGGWIEPRASERAAIADALQKPEQEIFGTRQDAPAPAENGASAKTA